MSLLNYDSMDGKNVSLFGVFDGHGGSEVAQYTARHLPNYIKKIQSYKDGQLEVALEEAFLQFDKHLTEPAVVEELKALAGTVDDSDAEDARKEASLLCEEAQLPIDDLIAKYGNGTTKRQSEERCLSAVPNHLKSDVKPKSPFLRAKSHRSSSSSGSTSDEIGVISGMCSSSDDASSSNAVAAESACSSSSPNAATSKSLSNGETAVGSSSGTSIDKDNHDSDISSSTSIGKLLKGEAGSESSSPRPSNGDNKISTSTDDKVSSPSAPESSSSGSKSSKPIIADCDGDGNADTTSHNNENDASPSTSKSVTPSPTKPDKGKRKKVIDKSIVAEKKDEPDETPTYEKFLKDFESSDSQDSEDEDDFEASESDSDEDEEEDDDDSDDDSDGDDDESGRVAVPMFGGDYEEPGKDSGCTAVVAILCGNDLYVANAGDSRCVVSRAGQAIEMSIDHKPEDDVERTRIERAGGQVTGDGRVNGGLNLSRALGDHAYKENDKLPLKEQMISSQPDIKKLTIGDKDEFMVLACDGIWNSLSSQQVIDYVRPRLQKGGRSLSAICEEVI